MVKGDLFEFDKIEGRVYLISSKFNISIYSHSLHPITYMPEWLVRLITFSGKVLKNLKN